MDLGVTPRLWVFHLQFLHHPLLLELQASLWTLRSDALWLLILDFPATAVDHDERGRFRVRNSV